MLKAAIIKGSDSGLRVLPAAAKTLEQFSVPFEIKTLFVHRTTTAALPVLNVPVDAVVSKFAVERTGK